MPSLSADRAVAWQAAAPAVELWRDYDPAARRLPGMSLGTRVLRGPARTAVTEWYDAGARCLRLPEPVRLCADAPPESARALLLVREATSRGFAVLWSTDCADGCAAGRAYHHLHPPTALTGPAGRTGAVPAERSWRAGGPRTSPASASSDAVRASSRCAIGGSGRWSCSPSTNPATSTPSTR